MAQIRQLQLYMNNIFVGTLTKQINGALAFLYDETWLQRPEARPISLSLPLTNEEYRGEVVQNFFDNLLTDNPKIRARIQALFQIPSSHPFDLLAEIGKDCVGAIQLVKEKPVSVKKIHSALLKDKKIADLLTHYSSAPLGMTEKETEFRLSIAGAQEKTSFLRYKSRWRLPLGATPSSHIFKLPIGLIEHQNIDLLESCENEWLCTQIIKAFGLPVAEAEIMRFEGVKSLVVKRFDRQWSDDKSWLMRLPQEDCCQALGYSPALKYEVDGGPGIPEIMRLLLGSKQPNIDRERFFQSQIIFFLLAAIDGHAKNFSLFIEPNGDYRLTPLYDILSAYPLMEKKQLQKQKIKMAMALIGENKHYHWHGIGRRHFLSTAKAVHFSVIRAEQLIDETVGKVDEIIAAVSAILPKEFPPMVADSVFDGMRVAEKKIM